jgi:predicted metal-binding membrane protein
MSNGAHSPDAPILTDDTGWTGRAFAKPHLILWCGVALLVLFAWAYLGAMIVYLAPGIDMADAGPGMAFFNFLGEWIELDPLTRDLLRAICGPAAGASGIDGIPGWSGLDFVAVFAMWSAMTIAMMVPTAAPMIAAYADIALTAREKRIDVVPTWVLLCGYLSVWAAFCVLAVAIQWALASTALLSANLVLTQQAAAVVFVAAGLYQFTPIKHNCLVKCRTPLPFFMANWSNEASGVFKMGAQQGIVCVVCCWALMAVMFAAGLMNVIWMAALAVVMALEKILPNPRLLVRATGCVLIAIGLAMIMPTFV